MIKIARYVGVNTDFLTAQAFTFPKNPSPDPETVYLSLIISASGEDVFTKVRQAAPVAEETFYSQNDPIPQKIATTLNSLRSQLPNVEDLQILITALKENILYIHSIGNHKVFITRDQILSELTGANSKDQLISGFIKEGDKILLLNSNKENLRDKKIIENLIHCSTETLVEEAETLLLNSDRPEPIAVVLIENIAQNSELINLNPEITKETKKSYKLPKLSLEKLVNLKKFIPQNKKAKLFLLGAIALIVILSVLSIISFQRLNSQNKAKEAILTQAKEKLAIAKASKDSDPALSKKSLEEAKSLSAEFIKDNPKNKDGQALLKTIDDTSYEILKIFKITNWPLFLSLDLIKPGFNSQKLSFSLGKALLLDEVQKTLVLIDLKDKNNQILAGPNQLGNAKFASLNGLQALTFSEDKGVLKIDTQSKKITTVAKVDPEWGRIDDIFGFGSNAYLLDSFKNQIWKYSPTKDSFTEKATYIKDNSKTDLAGAKLLVIDYSVWVLTPGPQILKFTGGVSDFYSPSGLDIPLKELKSIFPTEETDTIYLLDSENQRIVVTKKNGEYIAQYTGDKLKSASDFAVDEVNKKIYILEGGKIYQIDLK